jgi:DNA helicase-2/ATP-dependent DNA helicase PcrA
LADTKPYGVVKNIGEYFINRLRAMGSDNAEDKIENIEELIKVAFEKESAGLMLKEFVSQMDLMSSSDKEDKKDMISMMTIHASKGLEASIVFGVGMCDGILPIENSIGNDEKMEEERRLMYVLITRAKKLLYLTNYYSDSQKMFRDSRFIAEIPDKYIS